MYSEGGVMATKAFDAITLTLYTGLEDSWSRGGTKADNILAEAHEERFNFCPHNVQIIAASVSADNCYKYICDEKKKAFLRRCVLHAGLELS